MHYQKLTFRQDCQQGRTCTVDIYNFYIDPFGNFHHVKLLLIQGCYKLENTIDLQCFLPLLHGCNNLKMINH